MSAQLDWVERRDLGIQRSQQRAERELGSDWTDRAAVYLNWYASSVANGQPFLIEDARGIAASKIPEPSNSKAWGSAVRLAARKGFIVGCGWAPTRCSNGNPRCLWKATNQKASEVVL